MFLAVVVNIYSVGLVPRKVETALECKCDCFSGTTLSQGINEGCSLPSLLTMYFERKKYSERPRKIRMLLSLPVVSCFESQVRWPAMDKSIHIPADSLWKVCYCS